MRAAKAAAERRYHRRQAMKLCIEEECRKAETDEASGRPQHPVDAQPDRQPIGYCSILVQRGKVQPCRNILLRHE